MRNKVKKGNFSVNAVSGTYVVMLGMDLPERDCKGLLGFALRRHDHTEDEKYWLSGYKTFNSVEPNPVNGMLYSTRKHPIQGFGWSDYSAKPGHKYTYEVVALRNNPARPDESERIEVNINTESEITTGNAHNVYFNRGASASQEYTRRYGDKRPEEIGQTAYDWLSRGAAEAIRDFINRAQGRGWSIRVLAYEFTDDHVLALLKEAKKRGVDVEILFHAKDDEQNTKNEEKIKHYGIKSMCHPRLAKGISLAHNKVIILMKGATAQSVLTGSTNFSEGGIYGHSNVVHICESDEIAGKYLWLWNELKENKDRSEDAIIISDNSPIPAHPSRKGTSQIFSARPDLTALEWYAKQAKEAKNALFMTFAFGMHPFFQDAYRSGNAKIRYALMEKMSGPTNDKKKKIANEKAIIALRKMKENKFAIGAHLKTGAFNRWLSESLSSLNRNVRYVHTKYMLVDPLGADPLVITGSANFSKPSTVSNDENMLVVRGDKRVADIYLGEFMRMYNHFAFREWLNNHPGKKLTEVSFLNENDTWWKYYYGDSFASRQRQYFAG